ncbi:MAG: S41 family peptidase [Bacteroidota bacterium]
MTNRSRLTLFLIAALGVGGLTGFFWPRDDDFFALRKNFQIFGSIYEELVGGYVDPLDAERLIRTGIHAMLRDLDPYTTFMDEAVSADIEIFSRGRLAGVGLNLGMRGGRVTVLSPVEGASGYKQGVRAGDLIVSVAGQPVDDLSLSAVYALLNGEPGTAVEVVIERAGEAEPLPFLLTREATTITNVSYAGFLDDDTTAGLGYIKLERFGRDADAEVRTALQDLQATDALQGLVLDLRDNPGGLLDAAVNIVQLFVPQGSTVVTTRGRLDEAERVYQSRIPPLAPDLPVVVLINDVSASASEIVSGALQDLDRAVVLGEASFGKGLVQVVRQLPHNTSLKMTTSRYYIPSGRSIQAIEYGAQDGSATAIPDSLRRTFQTANGRTVLDGRGIEPDVPVVVGIDSELEAALVRRAAFFFYANEYAAAHPASTVEDRFFGRGRDVELDIDAAYDGFQDWLRTQDFAYRTDAEEAIAALTEELDTIGYADAEDEADRLRRAILDEKEEDFARHAERLQQRLRTEILARYLSDQALIKALLDYDPQVAEAVTYLTDADAYAGVLAP